MLQSRISVGDIFREVADGAVAGFLVVPRPSAEEVRVALCRREDPRHEVEVEVPLEREGAPVSVAGSSPLMGAAGLFLFRFIFFVNAPVVWLLGKRTEWKKGAPQRPRAFEPRAKNRNLFFFFLLLLQSTRKRCASSLLSVLPEHWTGLSCYSVPQNCSEDSETSRKTRNDSAFGRRPIRDAPQETSKFRRGQESCPTHCPRSTRLQSPRGSPGHQEERQPGSTRRARREASSGARAAVETEREREEATGSTEFQFFLFEVVTVETKRRGRGGKTKKKQQEEKNVFHLTATRERALPHRFEGFEETAAAAKALATASRPFKGG